jgi:uncharacterized membrane protein YjjB (DUF3815 family)
MIDWVDIVFKAFWCGWAAVGFGILFNVPPKTLFAIWVGGAIAGLVKFTVLSLSAGTSVIHSSFFAAFAAGAFSILIAHPRREPPLIFAIPSVIPLVPGVFAYKTMIGFIRLSESVGDNYSLILSQTVHNGVITLFIIMSIAIGVAIPMNVLSRNETKNLS